LIVQLNGVLFRRVAAVLLFAVFIVAIFLTARNEGLAAQSPKARSSIILRQVVAQELSAKELRKQAQQVALSDPLHAVGFFLQVMALDLDKTQTLASRRKLIAQSTMRQPAFDAPRIWLAADDVRRGRYADAIDSADTIMRLNGDYRELLLSILVPLLDNEKAYPLLEKKLRGFPIWRTEFIAAAIKAGGPDIRIERMLRHKAPQSGLASLAAEQSAYLKKLVELNRPEEAYRLWQSFLPGTAKTGIFDGDFTAKHPVYPFAWTFGADPYSYAEKVPASENERALVRAHHGGDGRIGLMTQLISLKPGSRLLSFTMRDGGLGAPEKLFWRVRCMGSSENLGSRSLAKLADNWQKVQMRVEIPASGCALQNLLLEAEDHEGEEAEVEIRLVEAG
jgi:hypothetical protein